MKKLLAILFAIISSTAFAAETKTTLAFLIQAKKQRIEKEIKEINDTNDNTLKCEKLKEFIKNRTVRIDGDVKDIFEFAKKQHQDQNMVQMGVGGAAVGSKIGFWVGKIGVSLIGHGTIAVISYCTGPAAWGTEIALETAWGPWIEATSIKAGLVLGTGCGIAGAVATGPV